MGHAVRDGSRTTDNYESDDPHVLADIALATDCVIALVQEHCERPLFAIEPQLNREELERIGARVGQVFDHEGPLPHPADDWRQQRFSRALTDPGRQ